MSSKSKNKGNRGETQVVKLLREYWGDNSFQRNLESGAAGTLLERRGAPKHVIGALKGDIMTPENFPFCVEVKNYQSIDLFAIFRNPENNDVEQWWKQCCDDAEAAQKIPMMFMKYNFGSWYVVLDINKMERFISFPNFDTHPTFIVNNNFAIMLWEDFANVCDKQNVLDKIR